MDGQREADRIAKEERRGSLRRLDDLLLALEMLNLQDLTTVPQLVVERLHEIGIPEPERHTVPQLIERVWDVQAQYLIAVPVERRQYRRRRPREGAPATPWNPA